MHSYLMQVAVVDAQYSINEVQLYVLGRFRFCTETGMLELFEPTVGTVRFTQLGGTVILESSVPYDTVIASYKYGKLSGVDHLGTDGRVRPLPVTQKNDDFWEVTYNGTQHRVPVDVGEPGRYRIVGVNESHLGQHSVAPLGTVLDVAYGNSPGTQ